MTKQAGWRLCGVQRALCVQAFAGGSGDQTIGGCGSTEVSVWGSVHTDSASWLSRTLRGEEGPDIYWEDVEKDLPRDLCR